VSDPLAKASMPGLLRAARAPYSTAVRAALAEAGCDDLPRNGPYVISGIAGSRTPLSVVITQLGVSKQAAGQIVDTLVARGYLERTADPADRRRVTIALTPRGLAAAEVIRAAVDRIDGELAERVGARSVTTARAVLAALIGMESDVHVPRE
jgi:DNA-binding MarR family transcriptional regulator